MQPSSTSKKINAPVSVSETDYLDEDAPIRNQQYVCLSFISPEDVLVDKEVVFFSKYVGSFSKEVDALLTGLAEKYPEDSSLFDVIRENNSHIFNVDELQEQFRFFKGINGRQLESDFHTQNDFKTSIRGIKVRGTFDTLKDAQVRAEVLKKLGDKFDIFVAQVGCWCPWSPHPEDMENQEYAETQLNTIMGKYKENALGRDMFYNQRKDEKIVKARLEAEKITANNLVSDKEADPSKTATDILADASIVIEKPTVQTDQTDVAPTWAQEISC